MINNNWWKMCYKIPLDNLGYFVKDTNLPWRAFCRKPKMFIEQQPKQLTPPEGDPSYF